MSSAIETLEQVSDVDEALRHLSLVPASERGEAWHAYLDAILEKRRAAVVPAFSDKEIS
ncbi:MAG TPA: hypothetical protein VIG24_10280 [Acidimicrobiia bacterium]